MTADIDERNLVDITRKAGGRYFHAETDRVLENIFDEIKAEVSSPIQYIKKKEGVSLAPYVVVFIGLLSLLHCILYGYFRRKYK
jgi:hypothetical protein